MYCVLCLWVLSMFRGFTQSYFYRVWTVTEGTVCGRKCVDLCEGVVEGYEESLYICVVTLYKTYICVTPST